MFLTTLLLVIAAPASAGIDYRFGDAFTEAEKRKLTAWIGDVATGLEDLVGPYPFDIQIRFVRADAAEPVPWANTLRGRTQGVRFHVNPDFSKQELLDDWTAAHELSHLVLPFLGRENSWFAEGFASYMQYQVMHAMGVLSADEVTRRYWQKLDKAANDYRYDDRSVVEASPRLRQERKYPVMYWGGSVFFMRLNERLQRDAQTDLISLVSEHMRCCWRPEDSLGELVRSLDRLLEEPFVEEELRAFRSETGFPDYDELKPGVVIFEAD